MRDRVHDRTRLSGPRLLHRSGVPADGLPVHRAGQAPVQCALRHAERRPGCPCWPGRDAPGRAPGPRASGPTTCCTRGWPASGGGPGRVRRSLPRRRSLPAEVSPAEVSPAEVTAARAVAAVPVASAPAHVRGEQLTQEEPGEHTGQEAVPAPVCRGEAGVEVADPVTGHLHGAQFRLDALVDLVRAGGAGRDLAPGAAVRRGPSTRPGPTCRAAGRRSRTAGDRAAACPRPAPRRRPGGTGLRR